MDRRNFMRITACSSMLSTATSKIHAASTFTDALTAVKNLKITNQSAGYVGAYMTAPNGYINWYFSNLGLYPFVEKIPNDIKNYLDLYLATTYSINSILNGSDTLKYKYVIYDIEFSPTSFDSAGMPNAGGKLRLADSDDAYAGTFLSLACRYIKYMRAQEKVIAYNAPSWLTQSNLAGLKAIAYYNTVRLQKPVATSENSGALTPALQFDTIPNITRPSGQNGYLMDNCEVYRGLKDFADMLYSINDMDYLYYLEKANKIRVGIDYLYSSSTPLNGAFRPNDVDLAASYNIFTNSCSAQVYPQAFRALDNSADLVSINFPYDKYDNSWKFLDYYFYTFDQTKQWTNCNVDDSPDSSKIKYPWMILGYVAALRSNATLYPQISTKITSTDRSTARSRATAQMQNFVSLYNKNNAIGTINELGFYQRTADALVGLIY